MRKHAHPPRVSSPPPWEEVHDTALAHLLNRIRTVARSAYVVVFAVPAPPLERVHVLFDHVFFDSWYPPTTFVRHYALAPLLRPAVDDIRKERGVTSFDLSFDLPRGRKTTRVEIREDSFDIWGVHFEDLSGRPHLFDKLVERTDDCILEDDEDFDEDMSPDPLDVRIFDIDGLHVVTAPGRNRERVERVFRLPWMSDFQVEDFRRRKDGSLELAVQFTAEDEESPLDYRYPDQIVRSVIREDRIDILGPDAGAPFARLKIP